MSVPPIIVTEGQGLSILEREGGGWWGQTINEQDAIVMVLNSEFGNLRGLEGSNKELPQATLEVIANRYNEFCQEGTWSERCFNSFWAYFHPITDMAYDLPDRDNQRYNARYLDAGYLEQLYIYAGRIIDGKFTGSPYPFHYATVSQPNNVTAFVSGQSESYWSYITAISSDMVPLQIFVILTSEQYTGTIR